MKRTLFLLLSLTLVLSATAQSNDASQFDWMVGEWQGKSNGGDLFETWARQDANTLTGSGWLIKDGKKVLTEDLRIQKIGDYWTFIPIINGGQPVLFTLISSDNKTWVFENKEHDFPQRVVYSQDAEGNLFAWIEGAMNGKEMKDEYRLKRVK